jgi:hypothetical protein
MRAIEPVVGQSAELLAQLRRGELAATMAGAAVPRPTAMRLHPIARVPSTWR